MININDIIHEVLAPTNTSYGNRYSVLRNSGATNSPNLNLTSVSDKFNRTASKFEDTLWQTSIINHIRSKHDVFVNVSPAGGKSYPVKNAWINLIKQCDINAQLHQIPKIMWICETKPLAGEVFRSLKIELYDGMKMDGDVVGPDDFPRVLMPNISTYPVAGDTNIVNRFVDRLVGLKMEGHNDLITSNTLACVCTYTYPPEVLKTFHPEILVIDEVQERFNPVNPKFSEDRQREMLYGLSDKIEALKKTISAAPRNCSILLLTGSMHPQTSVGIINYLNKKFNRKFFTIGGQIAMNRAMIHAIPDIRMGDGVANAKKIIPQVVQMIESKQVGNLIAIFSKNKILNISEEICKRVKKRSIEETVGLVSRFSNNYSNTSNKIPIDNKYGRHADPSGTRTNFHHHPEIRSTTIPRNLHIDDAKNKETSLENIALHLKEMVMGTAGLDQQLGNAILHGHAWIMSGDKDGVVGGREYNRMDILVVDELFKRGKINVVFATTAVGIGVNLRVRNLFIPSTKIMDNEMDVSSLIQLVNRAGRTSGEIGTIYCLPQSISKITKIVNSGDPSQMVDIIPTTNSTTSVNSSLDARFSEYGLLSLLFTGF